MINEVLNYRIVKLIGKGGMGSVYLAEHKTISNQKAAIKVINADMVNDFTRERLRQEARHLADLHHANIVSLFDYHVDDKGNVYLIMSFAEGKNLEDYILEDSGLIVEDRICQLFEPILDAVGYAHKHGIIHRDIKPSNVIITPEGSAQILDFGISTIVHDNGKEEDDFIMGTPSYMSPEQVKGEKVDERSDIYSLGVMLHQMLTGNPPYDTTTLTEVEINQKVVEEPLPRLRSYYKYVSDRVQKVVDKATAKNPDDRYQTCEEFKKALHKAVYPPKIPTWAKISAAIAAIVILGVGFSIWDYNRTKVSYYKDYTEKWSVPVGVGKISSSDAKHTHRMYRFTSKKGKVINVAHVNSLGVIINDGESERKDRPINQDIYYREDGKVSHIKVKNHAGAVQYVKSYNDKLNTMVYQFDDEHGTERVLSNSTVGYVKLDDMSAEKGRISRWWIDYDDDGYITKIRFAGLDNTPVADGDGLYGMSFTRDEKGRPVEIVYISDEGKPQSTKWGLGKKKFHYDEEDNLSVVTYLTPDNKPAPDSEGGPLVYRMEYDKYGNVIKSRHQDGEGHLMIPKRNGIAGVNLEYDDKGFIQKSTLIGPDGEPMIHKEEGYATQEMECDDNGFFNSIRYFDTEGNPIAIKNGGYHKVLFTNDSIGNLIESWIYGIDGNLTLNNDGYSGQALEYDNRANETKRIFYGIDKQPINPKFGYAGIAIAYDDKNMPKSVTYLNELLVPAFEKSGIKRINYEYDKRGNRIRYSYTNESGDSLINCHAGYAEYVYEYDDRGLQTESKALSSSGQLAIDPDCGYARCEYKYDDNGNRISTRYFGRDNRPILVDGIAGKDMVRDRRGNILEETQVGADGKLANGKLKIKRKYDDYGNETEYSLYDRNDKAALNSDNIHMAKTDYDSNNQEIMEAYYGVDGLPTISSKTGSHKIEKEYDEFGNVIKQSYYGTDGKRIKNSAGYSFSTQQHDVFGNIVRQCFYDVNGEYCDLKDYVPIGICTYDKWGNMVYLAAQDKDEKFVVHPQNNFAISRMEYDSHDHLIKTSYFDEKDKPMLGGPNKIHAEVNDYDSKDHLISESYLGVDGKPMLLNGISTIRYQYDENGNLTELSTYGTTGSPKNCDAGWQRRVSTYRDNGSPKERRYYTSGGELISTSVYDGGEWKNVVDWKSEVRKLQRALPMDLGGIMLAKINITGPSSCEFIIILPLSSSDINSEVKSELKDLNENVLDYFYNGLDNQAHVTVKYMSTDGKLVYSATK